MQKIATIRGLCSTCNKAHTCTFPRDPELPIWHCEEFDEETAALMRIRRPIAPVNTRYAHVMRPEEQEAFQGVRGLCRTCDKSKDCTFPKPETGVWHCEEYT